MDRNLRDRDFRGSQTVQKWNKHVGTKPQAIARAKQRPNMVEINWDPERTLYFIEGIAVIFLLFLISA